MADKQMSRRRFLGTGALALGAGLAAREALAEATAEPPKRVILNHNERMEYRRLGKTGLWVSAVSLGGHWKRCPFQGADFEKNRTEIMARCLDAGFNYVDACSSGEVLVYAKAVKNLGRRDKLYFGFDAASARDPNCRTKKSQLAALDDVMKRAELDYVDVWRVTCHEPGGLHTYNETAELAAAGEQATRDGKVRCFGVSTHDRRWADFLIREFPIVSVLCTPYTARSKEKPRESFFDTVRKCDVGIFGIKPFASNSIFKGTSKADDPNQKEDDEAARLALRYVLCNDAITSPIPGLIFPHHVDNCLKAIEERRQLDLAARPAVLDDPRLARVADDMGRRLPASYQWLRNWESV
jgi:aryl-alcohol dehydrogenase-like predicted oxidoreductase